jgi:hypothetical protein
MATCKKITLSVIVGMVLPLLSQAQGLSDQANSLHTVLNSLCRLCCYLVHRFPCLAAHRQCGTY